MSHRPKSYAKHPRRLAFEALEPRALLTTVADWWSDVDQWATDAWWSDESWWDEAAWAEASAALDWAATDWASDELSGLDHTNAEMADAEPEAAINSADEPTETPVPMMDPVAEDATATSSEDHTLSDAEELAIPVPAMPLDQAPELLPATEDAEYVPSAADEPHDRVDDAPVSEPVDPVATPPADVEHAPLPTDDIVDVAQETKRDDVVVEPDFGDDEYVDETLAMPAIPIPPVFFGFEAVAAGVTEPVFVVASDTKADSAPLESDEQPDPVAAPAAVPEEPTPSTPAETPVVASAESQTGNRPDATPDGRRLAFLNRLLAFGGFFGFGGAAFESGGSAAASGAGVSGFVTAQPGAGRPRARLPFRWGN